jgi:hypothetical protein
MWRAFRFRQYQPEIVVPPALRPAGIESKLQRPNAEPAGACINNAAGVPELH